MLTIRLQRVGKKGKPTYKLVISEKARDTQDVYLEQLGSFDPHVKVKENQFKPVVDRIKYWLSKGAQMSPTIENLLINAKVIEGKKKKSVFLSKKRKTKIGDKKVAADKAAADKKAAAESATAAKVEAPAPEVAPAV
jgi:small subunit ribosomal protein S16